LAYIKGAFTYVSGPLFIREFNLNSAATVKQGMPVRLNGAGNLIESQGTDSILAGFILHDAVNSVPSGKALVAVPGDGRTIFVATAAAGVTASLASSGLTLGQIKSGNSWFLSASGSTVSAMYVVVPREDGSTLDSTDSSVFVQVIGNLADPFALQLVAPVI
jgi:hypothetical protein